MNKIHKNINFTKTSEEFTENQNGSNNINET